MVATKQSQDIGRLEGKIDAVGEQIAHLEKRIVGNGQRGLMERTTIVEQCLSERADDLRNSNEKLDKIMDAVAVLADSVQTHHADLKIHSALGMVSIKNIAVAFAFVVFIVVLIPPDISLFELIKSLLGL